MWLIGAAWACPEPGGPDDPFQVFPRTPGVQVVVEVWPAGAPPGWAEAILAALDHAAVPALVVVPTGADPAGLPALAGLGSSPHALGVALPEALVPTGPGDLKAVRAAVRPLERAAEAPAKAVVSRVGSAAVEGMLARAGFRVLLDAGGAADGQARVAAHFDGQAPMGVVFPPGPWLGEAPSRCAPVGPASLDELGRVLERAARAGGFPVVRWALTGRGGDAGDAAVVARWLAEVGRPSGAVFGSGAEARRAFDERDRTARPVVGGRGVTRESLEAAARALGGGSVLPRRLPGDLSLAEAFVGLALHAGGHGDAVVAVPAVLGPVQSATTASSGPTDVDREALLAWARALTDELPPALPSAARIGDRVLPAREILVALASWFRGDPPMARPVQDPDPNAPHLGWGG